MAGRVTSVTPEGGIKIKFLPMGEGVSDLLEKLAFRRHRRQIAGVPPTASRPVTAARFSGQRSFVTEVTLTLRCEPLTKRSGSQL